MFIKANAQDAIDVHFGGHAIKKPLISLIYADDSLRRVYINKLMFFISCTDLDWTGANPTDLNYFHKTRGMSSGSDDVNTFFPTKGLYAMYLIYAIIKRDTTFCYRVALRNSFAQYRMVEFFRKRDKKAIWPEDYKFVGSQVHDELVGYFCRWYFTKYENLLDSSFGHLPLDGTKYKWYKSMSHLTVPIVRLSDIKPNDQLNENYNFSSRNIYSIRKKDVRIVFPFLDLNQGNSFLRFISNDKVIVLTSTKDSFSKGRLYFAQTLQYYYRKNRHNKELIITGYAGKDSIAIRKRWLKRIKESHCSSYH